MEPSRAASERTPLPMGERMGEGVFMAKTDSSCTAQ
jgi:hypothetical protein